MKPKNKKQKEPLRGEKLLKTAINQILKHPNTWYQGEYHSGCGTKHCLAGWCQILSGHKANSYTAREEAQDALGITYEEANVLFRESATLLEMYHFAEHFNRHSYDRLGKRFVLFEP